MEMKDLLEKMYQFSGEPKQKPGDQVRGKDKAKTSKKGKGPYTKHPFQGKLVGGDSRNYHDKTMIESANENLLSELDQTAKDTKLSRDLAERWKQFKEDLLGVEERRPTREGSRHPRGHEPKEQYKTIKKVDKNSSEEEFIDKIVDPKTKIDILKSQVKYKGQSKGDPLSALAIELSKQVDQLEKENDQEELEIKKQAQTDKRHDSEIKKLKSKEMKEYGAPANDQQQNMTQQQQDALKKATLATNQMKSATGASASTQSIMKAMDTASQGKSLTGPDAKAIEPMVDVLAQAAADPSLSNQFKSLATQAKQKQQQQQQQQKKVN
jgi:hypothetical protein